MDLQCFTMSTKKGFVGRNVHFCKSKSKKFKQSTPQAGWCYGQVLKVSGTELLSLSLQRGMDDFKRSSFHYTAPH